MSDTNGSDKDPGPKAQMMSGKPTLADAVLAVMKAVPYVQKSKAKNLNYTFASEAELINRLHDAMLEAGLSFSPTGMELLLHEQYQTAKGSAMNHVIVRCSYLLHHAPSDGRKTIQTLGEASDTGDKAVPKAMTCAFKYALREMFLIETGDDPDTQPSDQGNERQSSMISPHQAAELAQLLGQTKLSLAAFLKRFGVKELKLLPVGQFDFAKSKLQEVIARDKEAAAAATAPQ